MRIKTESFVREKVNSLVIGFAKKTGLPLQMEHMDAKKLAIAATIYHVLAMIETNKTVKFMFIIMVKYFAILSGSFHISANMVVKNHVIFAKT